MHGFSSLAAGPGLDQPIAALYASLGDLSSSTGPGNTARGPHSGSTVRVPPPWFCFTALRDWLKTFSFDSWAHRLASVGCSVLPAYNTTRHLAGASTIEKLSREKKLFKTFVCILLGRWTVGLQISVRLADIAATPARQPTSDRSHVILCNQLGLSKA